MLTLRHTAICAYPKQQAVPSITADIRAPFSGYIAHGPGRYSLPRLAPSRPRSSPCKGQYTSHATNF